MDMQGPSCLDIAEDSSIEICSIWIYSLGRVQSGCVKFQLALTPSRRLRRFFGGHNV